MLCFVCENESTLFGLPEEDTTRNQWLSCIYNTVPEQLNPNIRVCPQHFMEDYFLNLGVACQLTLCKNVVSVKWGNTNFASTVGRFWLTRKYVPFFLLNWSLIQSPSETARLLVRAVYKIRTNGSAAELHEPMATNPARACQNGRSHLAI